MRRRLASAAAPAIATLVLAACGGGSTSNVTKADEIAYLHGTALEVTIPPGELHITLGKPTDHVTVGTKDHKVKGGWSYVPVGALLDATKADTSLGGAVQATTLALMVGGKSYPVPATYTVDAGDESVDNSGSVTYVAVPGDGKHVAVEVTYDHLTQTITSTGERHAGAAAPYYDGSAGERSKIAVKGRWQTARGSSLEVDGTLQPATLPYVPGRGWAPPGRTFEAVDVFLDEAHATRGKEEAPLSTLRVSPTLDGSAPVPIAAGTGPTPRASGGQLVKRFYFEVPTSSARVLQLTATYGGITGTYRVSID